MVAFHMWAAIRTVKSKIGTWNGYDEFSQAVPEVSRQQWATAIGEARAALANRVSELTRPLNRRPVGSEITRYTTKRATGFMQQVEVFVRDRDTGMIESRPYVVKTDTLRSRQFIVEEAMSRYQNAIDSSPEDYPEDVLGAAYVGTHEMIPGR